jgi:SulP family sulfate permease
MLTTMLRRSPPDKSYFFTQKEGPGHRDDASAEESDDDDQTTLTRVSTVEQPPLLAHRDTTDEPCEMSPLLAARSRESQRGDYGINHENGHAVDLEGQKHGGRRKWLGRTADSLRDTRGRVASILPIIGNPKRWNRHLLWQNAVVAPVACLPAVVVGLLLNILDALSYGECRWSSAT